MRSGPSRILGVVVGAVIALAVLVVWLSTSRSTTELAVDSPERTVQSYLEALTRHDAVEAARHLDPGSGPGTSETHLFQLTRPGRQWLISGTPWPLYACKGVST